MRKKLDTEEKVEKNRKVALAYYYNNLEKCRKYSRDKYHKTKEELDKNVEKKMAHAQMLSDRMALYYAHHLLRELETREAYDEERMLYILRRKSIAYMFDPETMRRHVMIMLKRKHRVPIENARKMAMIIRETVREYKRTKKIEDGKGCEEMDDRPMDGPDRTDMVSGEV